MWLPKPNTVEIYTLCALLTFLTNSKQEVYVHFLFLIPTYQNRSWSAGNARMLVGRVEHGKIAFVTDMEWERNVASEEVIKYADDKYR